MAQQLSDNFKDLGFEPIETTLSGRGMAVTKDFEGFSADIYKDDKGHKTVGYGFRIDQLHVNKLLPTDVVSGKRPLSINEADEIFPKLYLQAQNDAVKYLGDKDKFDNLNDDIKDNLVDMSYQLGLPKLNGFIEMKKGLLSNDRQKISDEMKDSKWYGQSGRRSRHHVESTVGKRKFLDLSMFNPFHVKEAAADDIFSSLGFKEVQKNRFADLGFEEVRVDDPTGELSFMEKVLTSPPTELITQSAEFFDNIKKSFQRGVLSADIDQASYLAMRGMLDYEKDIKPLKEKQQEILEADPIEGKNIISNAVYSVAQMLPAMGKGIVEGLASGAIAGGAAAAGGVTAPLVPGMFAAGQVVGSMSYWYRQGAGQLYAEQKANEIPDNIAIPMSNIAGAIYAGIEFSQVDKLIPGTKQAAQRLISDSVGKTVGKLALKYGTTWAQEVGEEGLQEIVMSTAKDVSANMAGKDNKRAGQIAYDAMLSGWEASKESAIPMIMLLAPSAGVDVAHISTEEKVKGEVRKEMVRKVIDEAKAEEAKVAEGVKIEGEPLEEGVLPPEIEVEGEIVPIEKKLTKSEKKIAEEAEGVERIAPEKPVEARPDVGKVGVEAVEPDQALIEEAKGKTLEEFWKDKTSFNKKINPKTSTTTDIEGFIEDKFKEYGLPIPKKDFLRDIDFNSALKILEKKSPVMGALIRNTVFNYTASKSLDWREKGLRNDVLGFFEKELSLLPEEQKPFAVIYFLNSAFDLNISKEPEIYYSETAKFSEDYISNFLDEKIKLYDENLGVGGLSGYVKNKARETFPKEYKATVETLEKYISTISKGHTWIVGSFEDVLYDLQSDLIQYFGPESEETNAIFAASLADVSKKLLNDSNYYTSILSKYPGAIRKEENALKSHLTALWQKAQEGAVKEKVRGLSKSIERKAIEEGLTKTLGDLPTYQTRNMADVAERASDFINTNYELAKKIALREAPEQNNLRAEELFTAISIKAVAEENIDTIRELATSEKAAKAGTEAGQRIKALDSSNENDPVKVVKTITKEREEYSKGISKEKKDVQVVKLQEKLAELEEKVKTIESDLSNNKTKRKASGKKSFGAKNKVFTQEGLEDARTNLRGKLFGLHSGVDPTAVVDLTKIGGFYFEGGIRNFSEWSKTMAKEFGDKVRPYLRKVWGNIQKQYNESKIKGIKEKLSDGRELENVSYLVQQLAESLVAIGSVKRGKLVGEVKSILEEYYPDITTRETADLISGYGQYKLLNKDRVKQILRDIKGQLQQISKIEDLKKGTAPLKTGVERRPPSDEERRLIKLVENLKRQYGIRTTDPATQLKTALEGRKTRLRNQIKDLEKQINERKKIIKDKVSLELDREAIKLTERKNELKKQFDEIFKAPKKTPQEIALKSLKTRLENETKRLESKLEEMDFEEIQKREVILDAKAKQLKEQRDRAKNAYNAAKYLKKDLTKEEMTKIVKLSKNASDAKAKLLKTNDWTADNVQQVEEYFYSKKEFEDYVESLMPIKTKDVVNNFVDYFRASILASPRILRNSFLYQVIPGIERTITKRLVTGVFNDADINSGIIEKIQAKLSGIKLNKNDASFIKKQVAMAARIYHKTGYDISRMDRMGVPPKYFGEHVGKIKGESPFAKYAKIVNLAPKWMAGGTDMLFANIGRADTAIMMSKERAHLEGVKGILPEGMSEQERAKQLLKDSYSFSPSENASNQIREAGIRDAHMMNNTQPGWWSDKVIEFRRMLSIGGINFGKALIPFAKIANVVVAEGVKTASGYGIAKSLYDINQSSKETDLNKRVNSLSIAVNNLVRYAGLTGAALVFAAFLDDDDFVGEWSVISKKEYILARAKGAGASYIKIGGKWISLRFLPMINIPVSAIMTARQAKAKSKNVATAYASGIVGGIMSAPGVKESQVLLQRIGWSLKSNNMEKIAKSMKMDWESMTNWAKVRMIPSVLSYDVWNALFPKDSKYDFMGREIQKSKVFKDDTTNNIILEYERLAKTGNIPVLSDPNGKYAQELEKKLGEEEYQKTLNKYKQNYASAIDELINRPFYKVADNEEKKKKIDGIRRLEIMNKIRWRAKL